jgi:DNA-binding NarL/FixJ family response regulator
MGRAVRILLVDDHTLVRAGIRSLVESLPGLEVIAEASNGREALELAERHEPDVVLIDINMPELNGLDAAARLSRTLPATRVIILSMLGNEEYVAEAIRSGASGYVMKDADASELEVAIKAVMRGDTYLSPQAARHATTLARRAAGSGSVLTTRQREILQLIAEGASTKDIARKLNLGVRTVETHRVQIMDRLEIRDIAGLVKYAIRTGLTRAED